MNGTGNPTRFDSTKFYAVVTDEDGWVMADEDIRASLASLSLNQMEKNYLDFYSNTYKQLQIKVADSLRYEDNEEINIR